MDLFLKLRGADHGLRHLKISRNKKDACLFNVVGDLRVLGGLDLGSFGRL